MKAQPKRILFFAEAVTLAHIARCVTLAEALNNTGSYIIALAADDRYEHILGEIPYQRIPLQSVSSAYFFKKLSKGSPLYDVKTLTNYVKEDIKIIEEFKPDFIFGDFRLSLAISCKLNKVPYATITNAYWSPYADISYPIPENPMAKIFGVNIAQKMFNMVKPVVFYIHSLAFNTTCKKFGLPTLPYDMRETYTHADYTLYADIESLIPMKQLPDNHLFIGPILWSAQVSFPDWWEALPTNKPIVFVTLGSSGDSTLLPMILEALSVMPITVICVTAQKHFIEQDYSNVFVTDFLPGKEAVKKADIVICNGGSPMVYQSLVENKSVIGIPGNLDQYLMMSILQATNKGELIRAGKANTENVRHAVNSILSRPKQNILPNTSSLDIEKIEVLIEHFAK